MFSSKIFNNMALIQEMDYQFILDLKNKNPFETCYEIYFYPTHAFQVKTHHIGMYEVFDKKKITVECYDEGYIAGTLPFCKLDEASMRELINFFRTTVKEALVVNIKAGFVKPAEPIANFRIPSVCSLNAFPSSLFARMIEEDFVNNALDQSGIENLNSRFKI